MKHGELIFVDTRPDFSKAKCAGASPDTFFPVPAIGTGRVSKITNKQLVEARKYCVPCPIKSECLEYACRTDSVGIWGGVVLSIHLSRKLRKANGWELQREVISVT